MTAEANPMSNAKARRVFAGEQVITTAIYSLSQKKKPLVVFVRTDGEPLTLPIRNGARRDDAGRAILPHSPKARAVQL